MLSHHHAAVYANQFPVGESLCYDASCLLVVFRLVVCRINHGIVYDDEVGVCGRQSFTVLIYRLRHRQLQQTVWSAVVGAQQRDNGLLFISLCALPQNAQNAAGICDNGARFPRLSDKARWCPTSRRIYHFRCAAGDECNGTLHYKAAGAAADQPFFIL